MDLKKYQSTRYHGNDKQTQMELGLVICDENNRQLLDNPHYVLDPPGTHKEPRKTKDKMEERFRKFCKTLALCCAKRDPSGGQWGRPTTNDRHSKVETELNLFNLSTCITFLHHYIPYKIRDFLGSVFT